MTLRAIPRQARRRAVRRACRPKLEGLESRQLLAIDTIQYPIPGASPSPQGIALGSDGNLWFTEALADKIGVFNPSTGTTLELSAPAGFQQPYAITSAPDGNLWFTDLQSGFIGEINPTTKAITEYSTLSQGHTGIAVDLAGNVWLAGYTGITEFNPVTQMTALFNPPNGFPVSMTRGADGNIWFTNVPYVSGGNIGDGNIGVINPTTHAIQEFPVPFPPNGIATGPDGNFWYTSLTASSVGSINPTTHTTAVYPLPQGGPTTGIASGPGNDVTFGEGNLIGAIDTTSHAIRNTVPAGTNSPSGVATGPGGTPWFINSSGQTTGNTIGQVLVIPDVATTTTLSATPNPATLGSDVSLTVAVTPSSTGPVNVGTLTLFVDGQSREYAAIVNGQAQFSLSGLAVGNHVLVAQYSGLNAFVSSSSPVVNLPVLRVPTTTTLQVSSKPAYLGNPLVLTAIVAPNPSAIPAPVGFVEFFDGATPIGTAQVSGAVAELTYTPTIAGVHQFTAQYLGDANNAPSISAPSAVPVFAASASTTTLYPFTNPVPLYGFLTLTATVTSATGQGVPTGTVTFNVEPGSPVPLDSRGVATLVVPASTVGHVGLAELFASYQGDPNFKPSTSNTVDEYVGPPDGPQVTSLVAFGPVAAPTGLVLTFNEALHPATAQDPANYVIVGPNGRRVPINSAVYDPNTDSVTVTPKSRLSARSTYVLTVIGIGLAGVTDFDGRLLDGEYIGQPGSNYSTAIVPGKLVVSPALPAAPTVNHRSQLAALRAEMAAYRASLAAARRHR